MRKPERVRTVHETESKGRNTCRVIQIGQFTAIRRIAGQSRTLRIANRRQAMGFRMFGNRLLRASPRLNV
jgi:hypothetical protein